MTSFDEREQAAESKFVHDAEWMFRAHARRDHLLGLWAGQMMGKSAADSQAYAVALVAAEITGGEKSLAARVAADLTVGGTAISAGEVEAKMATLLAQCMTELRAPL